MAFLADFLLTPYGFACAFIGIVIFIAACDPASRWRLRHIPGPWGLPLIGHLPAIAARDVTFYFQDVARKYGPYVQIWFGARPWVLVSDPVAVRKVAYRSLARPLSASSFLHMLVREEGQVDAEGLLFSRGAPWKAGRRAFESSVMHPERLASHDPAIRRTLDRFVSYLKPHAASGEALDIRKVFGMVSLAIAGEAAYGVDFWPQEQRGTGMAGVMGGTEQAVLELMDACRECFECLEIERATAYLPLQILLPSLRPLWLWLAERFPDAAQRRHMRARQKVAGASRRLMEHWQADKAAAGNGQVDGDKRVADDSAGDKAGSAGGGISSSSFLASMLEDRQRGSSSPELGLQKLSDVQVIAQGLTFLLGGYETTSTSLTFLAFLLASNPEAQNKLRAELSANPSCLEDFELLGQLPYLDAVMKESQRLYPVATYLMRDVTDDVDLGDGMTLPRGTFAALSIYNLHYDPQQWREPDRFLPERFLPETKGALGPADPNAFIPFGIGPRMCVGYKLATRTLKVVAAKLVWHFRLQLHPRQQVPLKVKTGLALGPSDSVWLTLTEIK